MTQKVTYFLLNILGFILIVKWFIQQVKDYKSLDQKVRYFSFKRFKYILLALIIISLPLLLINFTEIEVAHHLSKDLLKKNQKGFALITSLIISLI